MVSLAFLGQKETAGATHHAMNIVQSESSGKLFRESFLQ
jgi:hypothetical protein